MTEINPENPLQSYGFVSSDYVIEKFDPIRRMVADRLTKSAQSTPHYSLETSVLFDAILEVRNALNSNNNDTGRKVSVNDTIIKACAIALEKVPEVNVSYIDGGFARHKHIDISMAVSIPSGLITPVVKRANEKSAQEIAVETKDLVARALKMKLRPSEYKGGTFCISNLGMFGVNRFNSILNPPQACILSVGGTSQQAQVDNGEISIAAVVNLTLTCDHRVVDGAVGARFLQNLKEQLEAPHSWLQT